VTHLRPLRALNFSDTNMSTIAAGAEKKSRPRLCKTRAAIRKLHGVYNRSRFTRQLWARAPVKFLTSAEETELAERNSGGDISARNELVTSHLPLVSKIAKKYRRPGVEWDDLISEGRLGLFRAAETFDPKRERGSPRMRLGG
jgi:DNA-directed RNA polymerase sigma subunit (sigma70/sigma32)